VCVYLWRSPSLYIYLFVWFQAIGGLWPVAANLQTVKNKKSYIKKNLGVQHLSHSQSPKVFSFIYQHESQCRAPHFINVGPFGGRVSSDLPPLSSSLHGSLHRVATTLHPSFTVCLWTATTWLWARSSNTHTHTHTHTHTLSQTHAVYQPSLHPPSHTLSPPQHQPSHTNTDTHPHPPSPAPLLLVTPPHPRFVEAPALAAFLAHWQRPAGWKRLWKGEARAIFRSFSLSFSFKTTPSLLITLHLCGHGLLIFLFSQWWLLTLTSNTQSQSLPRSVCGSMFVDSVSLVLSCDM